MHILNSQLHECAESAQPCSYVFEYISSYTLSDRIIEVKNNVYKNIQMVKSFPKTLVNNI